jgi:xanthine dehydrogenase accessory factor
MDAKVIYFARDLIEKGEDFVIAKVVDTAGSTPRKSGAWLLMKKDGTRIGTVGGGKLEAETEKLALNTFETKTSFLHHFGLKPGEGDNLDMRCGGDVDIQIEYIDAKNPGDFIKDFKLDTRAYIFGAGHVGLALEPILRYIGFETVVVDDRKEYANIERFPEASGVLVIDSYKEAFANIKTDENSYIIIVTRGHAGDYDVLKQSLNMPHAYIGMIGSKRKVAEGFQMMREEGVSQEVIDTVYSPIGLTIYAETPEEIAISVAAEMIKVRSGHGK